MLPIQRKPIILHITMREKHAAGYISFLKLMLPEYTHVFAVRNKGFETSIYYDLDLPDHDHVYIIDDYNTVFTDRKLRKAARKAEKIIFSGIWYAAAFMDELMRHSRLLKKTWLQFWGGDYTCFKSVPEAETLRSDRDILLRAFKQCAGLVFLTSGEYEQFREFTGIENRHMTAPVPKDPRRKLPTKRESECPHEVPRILVGNSANPSSNHIRVLELLHSAYPHEIFDVICPLSYGGGYKYIREVTDVGHKYFNDHFIPLLNLMKPDEYESLLAGCDVGIYDFDRQQGLGNIGALLRAGKKIYLNPVSPLWRSLPERGAVVFDMNEIGVISFPDFISMQDSDRQKNRAANDPAKRNAEKAAQWRTLLKA